MPKNISKIYQRTSFIILALVISGLLNVCLFALQAKAATPATSKAEFSFAYDQTGNCVAQPLPEPTQTINYPAAPMPQCCVAQNRNFNATVNTANDNSAQIFTGAIISSTGGSIPENNSAYNTSRNIFPPPATLALATTVIRE